MIYICLAVFALLFQWNGSLYAANSHVQKDLAHQLLKRYSFKGYERVLDIGCGDGAITAEIRAEVLDGIAIGIDSSPTMIKYAEQAYCPGLFNNLIFIEQDVNDLSFAEEFDLVVSFNCLHWVADQKNAIEAIYQSLIPGGRLLVTIGSGQGPLKDCLMAALPDSASWPATYPTQKELESHLSSAGFKKYEVWHQGFDCEWIDRAAFAQWLRAWVPEIEGVDRERLIEETLTLYLKDHTEELITAKGYVCCIEAQK